MKLVAILALSALALAGAEKKAAKAVKPERENKVEKASVKTGKAIGSAGKDVGELSADGAKATGRGVAKGAKWVAKPWSKDKKK